MAYHWPADTVFRELTLEVVDRTCWPCRQPLTVCCNRQRRFFTCDGPVQLVPESLVNLIVTGVVLEGMPPWVCQVHSQ